MVHYSWQNETGICSHVDRDMLVRRYLLGLLLTPQILRLYQAHHRPYLPLCVEYVSNQEKTGRCVDVLWPHFQ